jgi:hypothetical protein
VARATAQALNVVQTSPSVRSHRFEEAIAACSGQVCLSHDKRFVDQATQQIQNVTCLLVVGRAHRLSGLQCPATAEDGQTAEKPLFTVTEQPVAPVERSL